MTAAATELPPAPAPAPGRAASPYKFLDFYERRDASNFAGRDQEIDDIAAGVARSRCFVLYGRSGLGKTSLLHAGVIPRLEQRGFEVRYLRVLADPVHDLCAAVAAELGREALAAEELPALLAARPRPFVLVLDQFEEFFLRFSGDPATQARFAGLLGRILDEGGEWVRLVISLREDYYAQLQDLERAIPDLTAHGHRLISLSAYGVRQAVVRPLINAGIAYEEPFVDRVIDELAAFDFDPPLLQIACGEIYDDAVHDARGGTVELRAAHIDRGGGIRGALTRYVAAVSEGLSGDDRLIACAVLDALTTAEDTKRAVRLSDLLSPVADRSAPEPHAPRHTPDPGFYLRTAPDELHRVLDRLSRARLVRRVHPEAPPGAAASGDAWYELLHDRLVPVVKAWLDAEPAFDRFRFAKKLIASLSGGKTWRDEPGALLSGTQLSDQVQPYAHRLRLSAVETEYVLRSAIHNLPGTVPAWAEIYDEATDAGSAAALLVELLAHARSAVRCGAARAIVDVADPHRQLPPLCATLALRDPREEVRRAAGRSLARIARDAELVVVHAALYSELTASSALQVVTDLVQFEGPQRIARFPRRVRFSAGRHRKRRIFHEHRDRIQERTGLGMAHGVTAAITHAVAGGAPGIAILELCWNPTDVTRGWPFGWIGTTVAVTGFSILCATLVGALVGWRNAGHLVRSEVLGGPAATWMGSGVRGPLPLFVAFLLFGAALLSANSRRDLYTGHSLVAAFVLTVLLWLFGPAAVRWIHGAITPGSSLTRAAIWSAVTGQALGLTCSIVVTALALALGIITSNSIETAVLVSLATGAVLCISGLVLYGGTKIHPIPTLPMSSPATRRRVRRASIAVLVSVPIATVGVLGRGLAPFWPTVVSLDGSDTSLEAEFHSDRPVYFRLGISHDAIVSSGPADPVDTIVPGFNVIIEGRRNLQNRVVRAGDSFLGALSRAFGTRYHLRLHATPIYNRMPPARSDRWTLAWADVWAPTPSCYWGEVRGTIEHALPTKQIVALRLMWPGPNDKCRSDVSCGRCPLPSPQLDATDLTATELQTGPPQTSPAFDENYGPRMQVPVRGDNTWSAKLGIVPPSAIGQSPRIQILLGYRLFNVPPLPDPQRVTPAPDPGR